MDETMKEIEQEATVDNPSLQSPSLEELVSIIDQETGQDRSTTNPSTSIVENITRNEKSRAHQFVRFSLNDTVFGIDLNNAMEVGQLTSITPLPNLPQWLLGISNVRGEILSIVDLKTFFEWPTTPIKRSHPFIILHNYKMKIGILVDRIMGTISLDEHENLQKVKFDQGKTVSAAFITGATRTTQKPVYLLDVNKLLKSGQMTNI